MVVVVVFVARLRVGVSQSVSDWVREQCVSVRVVCCDAVVSVMVKDRLAALQAVSFIIYFIYLYFTRSVNSLVLG